MQEAAGGTQLCGGQIAGIEAAVHTVRQLFSSGRITDLRSWWSRISALGLFYGYFANPLL